MAETILCLNAGSSNLKFALHRAFHAECRVPIVHGEILCGDAEATLVARDAGGQVAAERRWPMPREGMEDALAASLLDWVGAHGGQRLLGVGHRIVHGGMRFSGPARIEGDVLPALEGLCRLAPFRQPLGIAAIRAIGRLRPHLAQVACFDTMFHHRRPAAAGRLVRYGFHGLSYEYVARRLKEVDPVLGRGRVIAIHVGEGASLCAMIDGRSVDTTMGFAVGEGLEAGSPGREATSLLVYRLVRDAAAMASSLGQVDGLVFTGGIGESAADIRSRVCAGLAWPGLMLDEAANRRGQAEIGSAGSLLSVRIIPADEESVIARHAADLLVGKVTLPIAS